ncbi:DUF4189 domain-containing protein [Pseudoxanthomonas wuyuanensis]|nr:DUF4189 domain-containing protein [Pseudoxanthomonas wuyuanensis]
MKNKTFLFFSLLVLMTEVTAQNCGGMPAVNGVCIPPDSPTSPLHSTHGGARSGHAAPAPVFANGWGSVAADGSLGILGDATGMASKRKAEKAALLKCRERGGKACKVDMSYHNQCVVLVSGDSRYIVQTAASIGLASDVGIEKCSAKDSNCRVHYSACSLARRVR